jgi:hypothetical protein
MDVENKNTFAYLAAGARAHERGAAAAGACEITSDSRLDQKSKPAKALVPRAVQKNLHIFSATTLSAEEQRQNLLEQMEADSDFDSIRATDADTRHPTERSQDDLEFDNQLKGISLGPNTPDDSQVRVPLDFKLHEDPSHISYSIMSVLERCGLLDGDDAAKSFRTKKAK